MNAEKKSKVAPFHWDTLKEAAGYLSPFNTATQSQALEISFNNYTDLMTTTGSLLETCCNALRFGGNTPENQPQEICLDVANVLELVQKLLPFSEMEFLDRLTLRESKLED